jgi:hypothetical protein
MILSFSPIAGDARVLKQVAEFAADYDVTTCGYGPAPAGVVDHIRIPDDVLHNVLDDRYISRRDYRRAYWRLWSVAWVRKNVRPRQWDVVLANDVEAVPLALWMRPRAGVHADLHEYSPLLNEDWEGWRERITPYVEWLCRRYVAHADSHTTVARGIADEYERRFGFRAEVVTNAAPYREAEPTPVATPLRLVHSGAALADRRLELMIESVKASALDLTFDLYLTPNQPAYVDALRTAAQAPGNDVRVLDPVPYSKLHETLQGYDVGLFLLPPTTFNYRWALPNKLFDYVQARLATVISPSPEMRRYVTRHGFGAVAQDFDAASFTSALDALDVDRVRGMKQAAHQAAAQLAAASEIAVWRRRIDALAGRRSPADAAAS